MTTTPPTGEQWNFRLRCCLCPPGLRTFTLKSMGFFLCVSDYVIEEKTAVLQKRDSEGFGFVLRGAKGERMDR